MQSSFNLTVCAYPLTQCFSLLILFFSLLFTFSQLSSLHQAQSLRRKKRRSVLSIFSGFRKNRNSTISNQDSEWVCSTGAEWKKWRKVTFKSTRPENEMVVKLIQRWALTPLQNFMNIWIGENISPSPAVFLCFEFMALDAFELLLHNGAGVRKCWWKKFANFLKKKEKSFAQINSWVGRIALNRRTLFT